MQVSPKPRYSSAQSAPYTAVLFRGGGGAYAAVGCARGDDQEGVGAPEGAEGAAGREGRPRQVRTRRLLLLLWLLRMMALVMDTGGEGGGWEK